jgi:hypothetical protein
VGCGEDLWEGLNGAGWVGDAVVEDDDGAGGEIFVTRCVVKIRGMYQAGGCKGSWG